MAVTIHTLYAAAAQLGLTTEDLPCVRNADVDWGSTDARERRLAAYLCRGGPDGEAGACPLLAACDAYAAAVSERWGVWGGRDRETEYREAHDRSHQRSRRRPPAECGTNAGYGRHRRRGEDACGPCRAAHSAAVQSSKARRVSAPRVRATAV